jgi:hypothetical protein
MPALLLVKRSFPFEKFHVAGNATSAPLTLG